MEPIKEICVESYSEAIKAVQAGADRIELCENLFVGGTTPSYGTIKECVEKLKVPVMVMIRPRGGDFNYSREEFEIMKEDILQCKELKAAGVVFGLLNENGHIDVERTTQLVKLSDPLPVTFHKAIDELLDLPAAVSLLRKAGVKRILTSGGRKTALEGKETLLKMIELASTDLSIIVAGKVTLDNFFEIQLNIPNGEYHGRKLVKF